jgi:hypothetical protein
MSAPEPVFKREDTVLYVDVRDEKAERPFYSGYLIMENSWTSAVNFQDKLESLLGNPREEWVQSGWKKSEHIPVPIFSVTVRMENTLLKYCFPKYDRYPAPLITTSFARKVYRSDRWRFAIWYLETNRLRELLQEEVQHWKSDLQMNEILQYANDLFKFPQPLLETIKGYTNTCTLMDYDIYQKSIISTLLSTQHPTRYNYERDRLSFITCIDLFCEIVGPKKELCAELHKKLQNNRLPWGEKETNYIRKQTVGRTYLLNYFADIGFSVFASQEPQILNHKISKKRKQHE